MFAILSPKGAQVTAVDVRRVEGPELGSHPAIVGSLGAERYGDSHRLCYVRGPEAIIVELAEQIG